MRRVKSYVIIIVILVFMSWNLLTYYVLMVKPNGTVKDSLVGDMRQRLNKLEADVQLHLENNNRLLSELKKFKHKSPSRNTTRSNTYKVNAAPDNAKGDKKLPTTIAPTVIAVLVIACDRPTVSRCLDQLLRYRPSVTLFPIIVSQDCGHRETAKVIRDYGDKVKHIQQPDLSDMTLPWPARKFKGYYKISRHYKWALQQAFNVYNHTSVVIVEDDLDISPDFFEYFAATHELLTSDPSLWCVSAWNDNGKDGLIQNSPDLLYRTDFFPGLGWMLQRNTWLELQSKWPDTFWDDWMRHPDQRRGRACIRPEICRTSTFGKIGVSKGQFFEKHLKFIKLNDKYVPFTRNDLSYLLKDNYDAKFINWVYNSPKLTVQEVAEGLKQDTIKTVRVEYTTKAEYVTTAKKLGIMDDLKAGVPRAGYRGVATLMYKGRRVFVAPPPGWKQYDPKWN